jgi:selenocysteine lyase/cysteine desulfurase
MRPTVGVSCGGMVRVGPVHYNTVEEIRRFGEVLGRITDREG